MKYLLFVFLLIPGLLVADTSNLVTHIAKESNASHQSILNHIQSVLENYTLKRDRFNKDKQNLYQYIDENVSSMVGNARISRLLLGSFWNQLNRSQKQRWIKVVKQTLIRYSMRLLDSYGLDSVNWKQTQVKFQGNLAKITLPVSTPAKMDINVSLIVKTHADKWGIVDFSALNFSFISLKSKEFQSFIAEHGFEHLAREMEQKNQAYFCQFQPCNTH